MTKCMNCNQEFKGKRADAKYCSDVCRVIFNRNIKVESVTDNVTDKPERTAQGNIRESKPGDPDYEPQCETTHAFVESRPKTTHFPTHKRGKAIKSFTDLPLDVQQSINRMSINRDGTVNQTVKANRTAIAINYQHLFPDRYDSTGLSRTSSTKGAAL